MPATKSRFLGWLKWTALGTLVLVLLFLLSVRVFVSPIFDEYRAPLRAKLEVAKTEAEVIRNLGPPYRVMTPRPDDKTCHLKGYTHDPRPIVNRCLIYLGKVDVIAYVYIDHSGAVEDFYIGGSS